MILLPDIPLPTKAQRKLEEYQRIINEILDYEERVNAADHRFTQYNRKRNATFRWVRETLEQICSGARRCGYCEDSAADEVEHIKPKSLYPEQVFVWENYLYACGPCNGPKNNQYAVFAETDGRLTSVARSPQTPIIPPIPGDSVLIDPRHEDPLAYMQLDLLGTFLFTPIGAQGSREYQRAEYTITVLQLNTRDYLCVARREAYGNYHARLEQYVTWRKERRPPQELERLVGSLRRMGHPTVWHEMKRQHSRIPDLRSLFEQAPEAFEW